MAEASRRFKLVRVPPLAIEETLIKEGRPDTYLRCERAAVPPDAELIRVVYDPDYDGVVFCYRHESFPEVPCDGQIPYAFPPGLVRAVHVTADEMKLLDGVRRGGDVAWLASPPKDMDIPTINEMRATLGKPPFPPGTVRPSRSGGWEMMAADGWKPAVFDAVGETFRMAADDPAPHVVVGGT